MYSPLSIICGLLGSVLLLLLIKVYSIYNNYTVLNILYTNWHYGKHSTIKYMADLYNFYARPELLANSNCENPKKYASKTIYAKFCTLLVCLGGLCFSSECSKKFAIALSAFYSQINLVIKFFKFRLNLLCIKSCRYLR